MRKLKAALPCDHRTWANRQRVDERTATSGSRRNHSSTRGACLVFDERRYIGGQELSYAEVKAIASGNPAVLTLAEADAELQRLALLKKNHLDEQYVARRNVRDLPTTIAGLSGRLSKLMADEATATAHADDPIKIGGRTCLREDVPAVLAAQLDSLPLLVRDTTRIPLGVYRGLRFGIVRHSQFPPDVYLEGSVTRQCGLSREHQGPRAVLNALERVAAAYGAECVRVRQDLAIAESQLRDYQARLGAPFLSTLRQLPDSLADLSAGDVAWGAAAPSDIVLGIGAFPNHDARHKTYVTFDGWLAGLEKDVGSGHSGLFGDVCMVV